MTIFADILQCSGLACIGLVAIAGAYVIVSLAAKATGMPENGKDTDEWKASDTEDYS